MKDKEKDYKIKYCASLLFSKKTLRAKSKIDAFIKGKMDYQRNQGPFLSANKYKLDGYLNKRRNTESENRYSLIETPMANLAYKENVSKMSLADPSRPNNFINDY